MCYKIFKINFFINFDSGNPRHPIFQTSAPPQHQSSSYGNQNNGSREWRQYVQDGSSSIASNTSANPPGNLLAYSNPSIHWSSNNPSIGHYPVAPPNSPSTNYPTHVTANTIDYNQYQWRTFSPGTMISFVTQPQQNAGGNQNQHANVQRNTMPAGRSSASGNPRPRPSSAGRQHGARDARTRRGSSNSGQRNSSNHPRPPNGG